MTYTLPVPVPVIAPSVPGRTAYLVPSGDLRESANVAGWPSQVELERPSYPEAERPSQHEAERPSQVDMDRYSMPEVRPSMTDLEAKGSPAPAAHDSGVRQRIPVHAPANRDELLARLRQRRSAG